MTNELGSGRTKWVPIGVAFSYVLALTEREMALTEGRGYAELSANISPIHWAPSWEELISILARDPRAQKEGLDTLGCSEKAPLGPLDIAASKAHRRLLQRLQTGEVRSRAITVLGDIDDRQPLGKSFKRIDKGEWRGKTVSSTDLDGIVRLGPIPDYKRSSLEHGISRRKQSEVWWADIELNTGDLTTCFSQGPVHTAADSATNSYPQSPTIISEKKSLLLIFENGGWKISWGELHHHFRTRSRNPYILAILLSKPNIGFTDDALIYYANLLKKRKIKLSEVCPDIPPGTEFSLNSSRSAVKHAISELISSLPGEFLPIANLLYNKTQRTGCIERIQSRHQYTCSSSHSWKVIFNQ